MRAASHQVVDLGAGSDFQAVGDSNAGKNVTGDGGDDVITGGDGADGLPHR